MNKNDELNKLDDHVFTFREHLMRGSGVDARYGKYPDKPLHLVDKTKDYVYTSRTRRGLREFVAIGASSFFGLDSRYELPVIALNLVDSRTEEVMNSDRVILTGIYDVRTDITQRDPEVIRAHKLNEEGRLKFFGEGRSWKTREDWLDEI